MERWYRRFLRRLPRQERSRGVVQAILVATIDRIVGERGDAGVTVEEIAERAGVGVGSIYDYFGGRDDIFASVVAKVTEDNLRGFEDILAGTRGLGLEPAVRKIVDFALTTYVADTRLTKRVLQLALRMGLMPLVVDGLDVFADALAAELGRRDDIQVDTPATAAALCVHTMMGIVSVRLWSGPPSASLDDVREQCVAMFVRYLERRPPANPSSGTTPGYSAA